jgi:hypothetical protein
MPAMKRPSLTQIGLLWLFVVSAPVSQAAKVLDYVPSDALGAVVIRDLAATSTKVHRLAKDLRVESIGPLAFLHATTGIAEGLNRSGDFLLAVLPGSNAGAQLEFCIWLPVKDYDRLLTSLGGRQAAGITAIALAGEDLLVSRQGDWALIMDPDQRTRMEKMLAKEPAAPERISPWQGWIEKNDITVMALPDGVRAILKLSTATNRARRGTDASGSEPAADDLFGPSGETTSELSNDGADDGFASAIAASLQRSVGVLLATSPQFAELSQSLEALAWGVKFDDAGNARVGLRAAWPSGAPFLQGAAPTGARLPPTIFENDEFVVHGAGTWPTSLTALAVGTYARLVVDELKSQEGVQLADKPVNRYLQTVEQAAAEVLSFNVLALAGQKHDGVYTNGFVVLRVASADKFVDLAAEAMRLWNQMNRDAVGGPRLVFDVAELPVGSRKAVQYSMDLAAVDGAPALPEVRQAMERLFGPDGKLTLFLVKIDDQTALLGAATPEQLGTMLTRLDRQQPSDWSVPQFAGVNRLLPQRAEWRAYFSPHGYTTWSARQMDAIVGVPVIGGPLVKEFPETPPIGATGGVRNDELWIDIGAPAATIQGAGTYLQKLRARARR